MSIKSEAFTVFLLMSIASLVTQSGRAEDSKPPTTATRPSPNGPEQSSVSNGAPPASRTQTTGQTNQDAKLKEMNAQERDKIEKEGK